MKNRIRELRARFNLTQEELADKCEVTRQTIIAIEAGKYGPSLEFAFKLSKIFKMPIEEIFLSDV